MAKLLKRLDRLEHGINPAGLRYVIAQVGPAYRVELCHDGVWSTHEPFGGIEQARHYAFNSKPPPASAGAPRWVWIVLILGAGWLAWRGRE